MGRPGNRSRTRVIACIFAAILAGGSYANPIRAADFPHPVALHGYDPVAYFTRQQPVPGRPDFSLIYAGKTYRFANVGHMIAFRTDPQAYLPAFDGYCAYGIVNNVRLAGSPLLWTIVNDRLYLSADDRRKKAWRADIIGNLRKATQRWHEHHRGNARANAPPNRQRRSYNQVSG